MNSLFIEDPNFNQALELGITTTIKQHWYKLIHGMIQYRGYRWEWYI